jgi:hypothetical protein
MQGNRPVGAAARPGAGGAGERHVWRTPGGGTIYGGGGRQSWTGPGGTTFSGGGGRWAYTGPHGAVAIGGGQAHEITGPGGRSIAGGHTGDVVIGPNGNVHAGGARGAAVSGPGGAAAAGSRGGVTVGPGGAYAAGTRYVAATDLAGQGAYVRRGFGYYNAFTPAWYARYPGAWAAAGWAAGAAWTAATWGGCTSYVGYPVDTTPYVYDYGTNITYQDGSVYYDDQPVVTEAQYYDQAAQIADAGRQAQPAADEQWQPLGVFALVKGDETTSDNIFQLALDKGGVVRGNYYNALTDSTQPVYGSLDKKSQRVAWSVGEKKDVVFEAGLLNLTKEQTTVLVHLGKDRTEQYALFRIEQQDEAKPAQP